MEERKLIVATCSCGEPIEVPVKKLGQLIGSLRKKPNTKEFMREIAKRPRKKKNIWNI